jgi:protein-L-isoaspartate(D-aspartate) O-methyltransferase
MRKYEDTYRHKGLRKKLTDTLRQKGISDERVLEAINTIPRHFFLDTAFDEMAYEDRAFPDSPEANYFTAIYSCLSNPVIGSETV